MNKPIVFPDGTKCYTGATCRKHKPQIETYLKQARNKKNLNLSKTFSYLLRHNPDKANIVLDENGWVDIHEFIQKINQHMNLPEPVTLTKLLEIVSDDSKQRYSIENGKIRAAQGHSVSVDLNLQPKQPPTYLYHGTNIDTYSLIKKSGLKAMKRQHVHLSESTETAETVAGRRKGETIILKIDADKAHKEGTVFYQADNGVWLVESLPASYITS